MKLLFVHQNLGEFGGAETNIHLAASELQKRGHTVGLLYSTGTGRNESNWRQTFQRCFCLPQPGNVEMAEAVLEEFAPDVIYLHNFPDLAVTEELFGGHAPVVRMVHDHSLYCLRGYKYDYFTRRICTRAASSFCVFPCLAPLARNRGGKWPLKWASYSEKRREIRLNQRSAAVIAYSEYVKADLVRNGFDGEKIEICVPIRMREEQEPVSSLSERNLVLFAGQLIRGKGVDVLLRALARVGTRFEAIILGSGSHRAYCERLCRRLGLSDRVQFCGYVLPAELREFYLDASVFAMSSVWPEPFGMAGPEAMRYGLPVVAFDAGGIREWLRDGETGFLVPWKDTGAFAARIEQLLRDKALARGMGQRAATWVQRYEAGKQIDQLERLFERVVQQHRNAKETLATKAFSDYD